MIVFSFVARGAIINDLYEAKIEVANHSQVIREKAILQAFQQILIKISGQSNLFSNQLIARKVSEAISFMHAYSYEKLDEQLFVRINFDQQRVEDMLRREGVPVWDKRRPDTLIWLAKEDAENQQRRIVKADMDRDLLQITEQSASARGIRLIQPLWDLDDLQTLSLYDLWGGFSQQIILASERYAADIVFSARLYQEKENELARGPVSKTWIADWIMVDNGQVSSGEASAAQEDLIVRSLIDVLADNLAEKYSIDLTKLDPNAAKSLIKIVNLDSLVKYAEVLKFLNSLSVVESATLVHQAGTEATFQLSLLGNIDDVTNALALDNKIKPVLNVDGQVKQGLEFIWTPR